MAVEAAEATQEAPDHGAVRALLAERYNLPGEAVAAVRRLVAEKPVYRVDLADGTSLVVRATRGSLRYASALLYLEARGYPTTRLVRTADGAPAAAWRTGPVVVTTYLPGDAPPFSPEALGQVGEALGKLHALGPAADVPPPAPGLPPLPRAGMLPRNELAYARSRLDAVRDHVPPEHNGRCVELERACANLDLCEDLPTVFLHGDCHPWNAVRTPSGATLLIDWDSAGPGPAVIDVGFLLLSSDTGGIVDRLVPPNPARAAAVVAGYRRHRTLTPQELDLLPDAIRFCTLVGACASFAGSVEAGRSPQHPFWWWQRYLLADELAARARRLFERER